MQVVFEGLAVSVRVFVGLALAEGVAVPAPDGGVGAVQDDARAVQVVGLDEVDVRLLADRVGFDDRDRGVAEPDGFLPGCVVCVVFADQVAGGVVDIAVRAVA